MNESGTWLPTSLHANKNLITLILGLESNFARARS